MRNGDCYKLHGAGCLGLILLGLVACSSESTGTGNTSSGGGGQGGDTGGAGGAGAAGGSTGTAGGGAGGATTTGTGGGAADGACPLGEFSEEKQIVYDSGSSSYMDQDTVWTKDNLYIVRTDLNVRATLTIEAGTTVCFENEQFSTSFVGLHVGDTLSGAAIRMQGTADEHVTLTAGDPAKGWHGVHVSGDATEIDLSYTDFFFGSRAKSSGGNDHYSVGALRIQDSFSVSAPAARLHHVTFAGAKCGGPLWIQADAGLTEDSVVEVKAFDLAQADLQYNDPAVLVSPEAASSLKPGMITIAPEIDDSKRGVELLQGPMSADSTVHDIGLPYFVVGYLAISNDDGVNPLTMTIEAGVEVRLGSTAVIRAGSCFAGTDGDLIVDGTADKPVKLVHYKFPGDLADRWGGLFFQCYNPAVSRVSHALLQTGGGNPGADVSDACGDNSSTGLIILGNITAGSDYAGITIEHTTLDGSYKNGIVAECSFSACIDPSFDYMDPALGNTFLNIAGKPQILSTCP